MGFSVDTAFERLARLVVRFRYLVVVFWLAVAIVVSGAFPSLGSEVNNNNSAFLPANAPSTKAANLAAPLLGTEGKSAQVVIVASRSGPLTLADEAAVARVAQAVRGVRNVQSVNLLGLSADREAAQLRVRVTINRNDISAAKTVVDDIQGTFSRAGAPAGLQLNTAGEVATLVANQENSNRSGSRTQGLSFLFIIVLLLIVFRAPLAAIITLAPAGLALLISMNVIGELGVHGLQISSITQILLIVLILGAGTDYGLFLLFRVREELRAGRSSHEAVTRALSRVGESITASAGTVVLALLTLVLASFGLYHDLGIPLAVGIVIMLALGLTLLPALLAIAGRRAFWPRVPKPGPEPDGAWGKIAGRLVRRPRLTLAVGLVAFLALAAGALGYASSGFGGSTNAPSGSDAAAGNAALAQHFPQSSTNPANLVFAYSRPVWENPGAVATAQQSLRSSGKFTALQGPLNANGTILTPSEYTRLHRLLGPPARLPAVELAGLGVPVSAYNAYHASAQFVSARGTVTQFEATLAAGPQQSTQALDATPTIRTAVSEATSRSGAVASGVAGQAAASYDISKTANHDLKLIIPVAIIAIGLLLALVLRSLIAPLYLIVSVVISYLAALGIATIVFIDIGGDSGISFFLPFLMFVFLLALGEDYNILVMTRIREEARRLPLADAVVRAIARTGTTITSAGIILGGTFAVLVVSATGKEASQIRPIGVGLAVGILMDTFLVRTLLVPATVILLGRFNWWPSRMGRGSAASAESPPARGGDALDRPDSICLGGLPAGQHGD